MVHLHTAAGLAAVLRIAALVEHRIGPAEAAVRSRLAVVVGRPVYDFVSLAISRLSFHVDECAQW